MSRKILLRITLFALLLPVSIAGLADTIAVPSQAPTIQAGLDAASAGDTVLVACGTYYEHEVMMKSSVVLLAEPDCVEIDAQQLGTVLVCDGVDSLSHISGFHLRNGNVLTYSEDYDACGLLIINEASPNVDDCTVSASGSYNCGNDVAAGVGVFDASPVMRNCRIVDNGVGYERVGGLMILNSTVVLDSCRIEDNYVDGYDCAGILCEGSQITTTRCAVIGNENHYGNYGGLAIQNSTGLLMETSIVDNYGSTYAGGLNVENSDIAILGCTVTGNGSTYGVAGIRTVGADLSLEGSIVASNECLDGGGALWAVNSDVVIYQSTIANNYTTEGVSSGIETWGATVVQLEASVLWGNHGYDPMGGQDPHYGAAIYDGEMTVTCSVVDSTTMWGGIIYGAGNQFEAPLFCSGSDYHVLSISPCLPENNDCDVVIGGQGVGCYTEEPVIRTIADVPNDQGRQVRIGWHRSDHDNAAAGTPIQSYSIWRRIDRRGGAGAPEAGRYPEGEWDFLAALPACCEDSYNMVVPTLCDSTEAGMCTTTLFVRAMSDLPSVYWDAAPDSGYSVDNLSPQVPRGLDIPLPDLLTWDEVPDTDLSHYIVRAADSPDFGDADTLGMTAETWLVVAGSSGRYLAVTAKDFAGNESGLSDPYLNTTDVGDGATPAVSALLANAPNPFNPRTFITFDLSRPAKVDLVVFDLSGRRVRRLLAGVDHEAGRHVLSWDGRDDGGRVLPSGVYLCRISAGNWNDTRKMTLLR